MNKTTLIRTTFNWGWLTGSEVQSIIFMAGTWQHPGRHAAGGAESSTSCSEGCQEKTGFQAARMRVSKPTPTVTHLLQQGYISQYCQSLSEAYTNHHIPLSVSHRLVQTHDSMGAIHNMIKIYI